MKPTKSHTSSDQIPLTAFIVEDRLREDDNTVRQAIELSLAPSIATHGLIHPIVLNQFPTPQTGKNLLGDTIESSYSLIAGWCRCQAFLLLNHTSIPYTTRDKLSKVESLMLEVEENIRRTRMTWTARVLAIKKAHDLNESEKAKKFQPWSQAATGELLGVNRATVTQAIQIGKLLESGDKEILAAKSFDEAKQICLKRKEQELEKLRAARSFSATVILPTIPSTLKKAPSLPSGIIPNTEIVEVVTQEVSLVPSQTIPLSQMLFNDSCVYPNATQPGWMDKQQGEIFDLVFTDIPFGIDMGNLDIVDLADVEAEHDVQENVDQMLPFLKQSYRLLKDKSYCIFFMDLKHWEKLADWGSQVGFNVMPYPIIWHKLSTVKNRAASKWWPKKIEYLMVMAKGSATLKSAQNDIVIAASGDVERKKYGHPFAKPFEVIKKVLDPVVQPGYSVLDPYAGSGSMVCSMISMGLKPTAVEKKEEHYTRLILNVQETYARLLGNRKPIFT